MTFVSALALFPVVMALLVSGCGLLLDRLAGRWLPAPVIPVVGLAVLVAIGQLCTTFSTTAPLTTLAFVTVAALGYASQATRLRVRARALRRPPWVIVAFVAAYLLAIAPVLFAGRVSLAFYLTDTTTGTHLAGADWIINHGRHFDRLSDQSSYGLQLRSYFDANNYPSGGHVVLAGVGQLFPTRLTWLYQPYMAVVLAIAAGPAFVLLHQLGWRGLWCSIAAVVASAPALVYALDLTGSIKELTVIGFILSLGVLVVEHERWIRGPARSGLPLGVLVGAGLSAVGVPFAAWGVLTGVVLLVVAALSYKTTLSVSVGVAGVLITASVAAVVAAPAVVLNYSQSAASASGIATTTDPGNLLQPLDPLQALGIWVAGQYRLPPSEHLKLTYGLIGIALLAALIGSAWLTRPRHRALLLWFGALAVLWWQLTTRGTTWTDGKMILLSSPAAMIVALAAPAALWAQRQRLVAVAFGAAIILGVLRSDAQQYHETNLAPTARFNELAQINSRFGSMGPAIAVDFDEFTFYELRNLEVSGPGFAYRPASIMSANVGYGQTVDIDSVPQSALTEQRLIVQRRSPAASRPPSNFSQVFQGVYYDVWRRSGGDKVIGRLGSSLPLDAQTLQKCRDVQTLARKATVAQGILRVAERAPVVGVVAGRTSHSANWGGDDTLGLSGPGRLDTTIRIRRAGTYDITLKGQIGRRLTVEVDGRTVGRVGEQTAGLQNFLTPLAVRMTPGRHRISVVRPGGSLRPADDAPSTLEGLVVSPAQNGSRVRDVAPEDYESLCGRQSDWIEAVDLE